MLPDDAVPAAPATTAAADLMAPAEDLDAPAARPGRLVRFAAGAWHVLGGAAFILRSPRLWGLALLPALLGMIAIVAGLVAGVYGVRSVETTMSTHRPRLPDLADLIAALGLWTGTLAAGVLGGFAVVLVLSGPLLEWLQRRAEVMAGGSASVSAPSRLEMLRTLRHSFYLLAAIPPAFLVALIPFAGPPIAGVLVALAITFQVTAPALARRGLDFRGMRRWHRFWRAESLGFGVATLMLLPLLSPFLAPALATGAALLVHETYDDGPEPSGIADAFDKSTNNAEGPSF